MVHEGVLSTPYTPAFLYSLSLTREIRTRTSNELGLFIKYEWLEFKGLTLVIHTKVVVWDVILLGYPSCGVLPWQRARICVLQTQKARENPEKASKGARGFNLRF